MTDALEHEAADALMQQGREAGFLTADEISRALDGVTLEPGELDAFYDALQELQIDVVGDDPASESEHIVHEGLGDHVVRRAGGDEGAGAHRDEVVAVAGGLVEVVEHEHDGALVALVEVDEQVEDVDLVGEVEVGGGLVEQHEVGALGECHGDPDALALPAGEFVDGSFGERDGRGGAHCVGDDGFVGRGPLSEPLLVGVAATGDKVRYGDPFGCDRRLGQDPEAAGDFLGGQSVDALPVEQHRAGAGFEQSGEGS